MMIPDYRALAELRHQIRRFLAFSEDAAREAGLQPQQHQLLLAVKGLPLDVAPTIGEIAARLMVKHHTVVELVDRLVDNGLVVRERGVDRRVVLLRLTPAAERVLKRLSVAHAEELRVLSPALASSLRTLVRRSRAVA
jgi:DNA-binding MarR family transcriptional regulator